MKDELRSCSRAGCRWPAAASLSYRYATRQVWLLDLSAERDPNLWELCPHHADSMTVPRGWDRVDERSTHPVIVEPAGRDLPGAAKVDEAAAENRYAELSRDLPRLAAELAGGEGTGADRATPVPSRELTPGLPADAVTSRSADHVDESRQLALPGEEPAEHDEAVVVSIELAGARRQPVDG